MKNTINPLKFLLFAIPIVIVIPLSLKPLYPYLEKIMSPFPWDYITGPIFGIVIALLFVKTNQKKWWWLLILLVLLLCSYLTRSYLSYLYEKETIMDRDVPLEIKELIMGFDSFWEFLTYQSSLGKILLLYLKKLALWAVPFLLVVWGAKFIPKRSTNTEIIDESI